MTGQYKIEQSNGSLYLLPDKVLSANGQVKDAVSPLSQELTIGAITVPFEQAVSVLAQSVAQATSFKVKVITPFPILQKVNLAAANQTGRVALTQIMDQLQPLRLPIG